MGNFSRSDIEYAMEGVEDLVKENITDDQVEDVIPMGWELHSGDETSVSINVKDHELDTEAFSDKIDFWFENWQETFSSLGLRLSVFGRSDGWMGFTLGDFVESLEVDEKEVEAFLESFDEETLDYYDGDFYQLAVDYIVSDDYLKFIKVNPDIVEAMDNFYIDASETREEWKEED